VSLTETIVDQKTVTGTLVDQVRELDLLVRTWNRTRSDLSGTVRRDLPDYPEVALRQLIRNALMHRIYEGTNAPVRMTVSRSKVPAAPSES
jgi:ATP-dependent DNA helicase RecG